MRFGRVVTMFTALMSLAACGTAATRLTPPSAEVISVIDGDTIKVRTGGWTDNVRLIAIDTPEVAHHGNPDECHGPEATARLVEMLPKGTVVQLVRDEQARDIYGRLLAYVYAPDGTLINLQLAVEGHARSLSIAPNTALADAVATAVAAARQGNIGLWGHCPTD